jgi:hypothetical protein
MSPPPRGAIRAKPRFRHRQIPSGTGWKGFFHIRREQGRGAAAGLRRRVGAIRGDPKLIGRSHAPALLEIASEIWSDQTKRPGDSTKAAMKDEG